MISFFSFSHFLVSSFSLFLSSSKEDSSFSRRLRADSSFSFLSATLSISSCLIFLLNSSSSVGVDSISTLIIAQASSTRSIALSGRNLLVIYLLDKLTAATKALSVILTP